MNEIIYASAGSIARAIRNKEASAVEVVEAHLSRIEEVNSRVNAVVQLVADRALAEAREADAALARGEPTGPLHGVPITIKDSHDTEGIISTGGTKGRADFVPKRDATAVARLRAAGAILLGKTNTPELTLSFETDNLVYGRTNNPYDLTCTPGGSSGGAAAIIAAGGSPLDLGTDTAGSIRVPAHCCGIAGLKPTSGRVPRTGHIIHHAMGALDPLTVVGPMARYVDDLSLVLPIVAGPDWVDPAIIPTPLGAPADVDVRALTVACYADNGIMSPTAEVDAAVRAAADALSDAGVTVVDDRPEAVTRSPSTSLLEADGGAAVRRLLDQAGTTEFHPWVARFAEGLEPIPSAELTALLEQTDSFRSEMLAFMESYDAILCPVRAFAALPHGEGQKIRGSGSYTSVFNVTGWPATVVRAGESSEGLPIGVQLVARPWREDVSLALAGLVESALGGWKRPGI
jgi:amidase